MAKRTLIWIGTLFLFATAHAQEKNYKIISGNTDTLQYNYFMQRLQTQFDHRRAQVNQALSSEIKLLERRDELRESFRNIIGKLPNKDPLNPKVNWKRDMGNYTVEAVVFESLPNFHITGLFYLPKTGRAPYPAVYIPCGHSRNGKAIEAYQKAARLFASNGFAVLQADPICQGERYQLLNEAGNPKTSGGTMMHEFFGQTLALTGSSTLHYELYDNIRCLDFLEQHPAVDKERLAVAGNSGGGTQATYLMAYDQRIKVATPSCFIATKEEKMRTHGFGDFCQHVWGEGANGMEEQDFLMMAAPIPTSILSTEDDFFSIKGAKRAYKELKAQYAVLDVPEKMGHSVAEGPHGWRKPNREASVQWCKQWLLNDSSEVIEPEDIGFFTDEECLVSPTGQVLSSYENERSMFDLIQDRINDCKINRTSFIRNSSQKQQIDKIKDLIGFEEPEKNIYAKEAGNIDGDGYQIKKLLLERDRKNGFNLPALLLSPDSTSKEQSALIMVDENGKNASMDRAISEVKKGHMVLLVDISDTGEIKDKKQFLASWSQYFTAKFPLYEGKTLIAYRTEDIIIAARYLLSNKMIDANKLSLISTGNTNYAALHGAVISGYFSYVEINGELKSWEARAAEPFISQQQLSLMDNLVPDVLNYYDIPDLQNMSREMQIKVVQPSQEIADPADYLEDLKAELEIKWPQNRTINLVFHGHSVPAGYFKTPVVNTLGSYPYQLLKSLKKEYPFAVINIINTSIGGENSVRGADRFEIDVLTHKPDVLFLDYALNDVGLGLEKSHEAWNTMIQKALDKNIKIILLTPSPDQRINILEANSTLEQHREQIRQLAIENGLGFIDSYRLFKDKVAGGNSILKYMSQVNHPNEEGHLLITKEIMMYFK